VLECIFVWAIWYPGTSFEETYQVLLELQVSFPKKLSYFKPEDLEFTSKTSQNHEEIKENPYKNVNNSLITSNNANNSNIKNNNENHNRFIELMGEIQVSSQNLENIQEIFVVLLTNNQENDIKADLHEVMESFQKVKEKHQSLYHAISNLSDPELESQFLPKLMDEIEVIDRILLEFEKYSTKRITFKAFRFEFSQFEENDDKRGLETPEEPFPEDFKKNIDLEQIHEEELPSRFESVHSASMQGVEFDEKTFQKDFFSNIKSFNENRKKYLFLAKSDSM